jgi:hypothetical protein
MIIDAVLPVLPAIVAPCVLMVLTQVQDLRHRADLQLADKIMMFRAKTLYQDKN